MKAAEASADLDEAEWEEVNFYQREMGGGVPKDHVSVIDSWLQSGSGQRHGPSHNYKPSTPLYRHLSNNLGLVEPATCVPRGARGRANSRLASVSFLFAAN